MVPGPKKRRNSMNEGPLSDVKVLDFTHCIAGPYCTKLLADYGADVVKIERPDGGDRARRLGPFAADTPHPERSGLFLHLNTSKRGVTLNLKTEAGRRIVRELAKNVDIVVESFRPGTMARFGLGYDNLSSINPGLVMASISNFGQTGPYRDYLGSEIVFYGMGGEMHSTGLEGRGPVKLGGTVGLYQAGAVAAVASMGAFLCSRYLDVGQQVDVSIMDTQLCSQDRRTSTLVGYQYTGETTPRLPMSTAGYPIGVYPCLDGYFEVTGGLVLFPRVVRMLGEPDFLKEPRWYADEAQSDPQLREEFETFFLAWSLERTRNELWELGQTCRVFCAPVNTIEDVCNDPEFLRAEVFADVSHSEAGVVRLPGSPFAMAESPWRIQRPAPLLGQHNVEVLEVIGYSRSDISMLREQGVI